ncbi:hypothetical protein B7494_g4210, partial [Chlorociboria aeruginascens]
MLKRVASVFKKDKKDDNANGSPSGNASTSKIDKVTSRTNKRRGSSLTRNANSNGPSEGPDHSVTRDSVAASLGKFSGVVHASRRPLPTETGDGSYVTEPKESGLFDDLKAMRMKDVETLDMALKVELGSTKLTDDKTMLMERTIQLVSNLPSNSKNRVKLTNTFVGTLWDSLQHPPPSMLGDRYNYRQADGSFNNIQFPDLGKAGTAYARSVPPKTIQPIPKVDPGLIFDTIMSRENGGFIPHPNNVSSMLYYIASIIIHDCFRTSHDDFNISETSSYLDLTPLYGANQTEQDWMRTFKDGKIKPDCFAEKRLLGFPPGVGCILILAVINEAGRFDKPRETLPDAKKASAWKKYDNDLFQIGRLVTCGLYINVILLDYLRTIVGLNRVDSTWTLDPRVEMNRDATPRGTGNQCSAEFNFQRDERWSQKLYQKLFEKDYREVTMPELLVGLQKLAQMTPDDPLERDFDGLKRGPDGSFNDDDLVNILVESIEDVAGSSGANNVPEVLRAVEILGMQQARAWRCATLNEFRKFFGLTPHEKFEDINSDPAVSSKLKELFDHPDFVELYPGLVCENAKMPMDPGVGIGPTYTVSRAILSDAVTLVRGDRFYTVDYHPANLTNWGYQEVQYDLAVNQGCVFYKLFIQAFPNHFTFNSIYAHYPLTIPTENKKIMTNLNRLEEFSWDRPTRIPARINVASHNGVLAVLKNGEAFGVDQWRRGFQYLMGKPGVNFMLAGDGPFYEERRNQMKSCLYQKNWHQNIKDFYESTTLDLLKSWSYSTSGTSSQVDIIRDVGNSAHIYFAANIFSLPLKDKAHPKGVYTEHELYQIMAIIFIVIFFGDVDPTKTFPLRTACLPLCQGLGTLVEQNVNVISKTGLIAGIVDPLMEENTALRDYGVHMIRNLLKTGLGVHEVTWSQILPTAGAMVANQAQVFGQIIDFYTGPGKEYLPDINRLAKQNTSEADEALLHYVMEAIRLNGTFGAYRKSNQEITIPDGTSEKTFKPGDSVFVSFVQIGHDATIYPDSETINMELKDRGSSINQELNTQIIFFAALAEDLPLPKSLPRLLFRTLHPSPAGQKVLNTSQAALPAGEGNDSFNYDRKVNLSFDNPKLAPSFSITQLARGGVECTLYASPSPSRPENEDEVKTFVPSLARLKSRSILYLNSPSELDFAGGGGRQRVEDLGEGMRETHNSGDDAEAPWDIGGALGGLYMVDPRHPVPWGILKRWPSLYIACYRRSAITSRSPSESEISATYIGAEAHIKATGGGGVKRWELLLTQMPQSAFFTRPICHKTPQILISTFYPYPRRPFSSEEVFSSDPVPPYLSQHSIWDNNSEIDITPKLIIHFKLLWPPSILRIPLALFMSAKQDNIHFHQSTIVNSPTSGSFKTILIACLQRHSRYLLTKHCFLSSTIPSIPRRIARPPRPCLSPSPPPPNNYNDNNNNNNKNNNNNIQIINMSSTPYNAGTSSRWVSNSSLEVQRLQRIQLQGTHIGVWKSPYLPHNVGEYLSHQAQFKRLEIEKMKRRAETRRQERKAEKESETVIPKVEAFMRGKARVDDGRGAVLAWRTVFRSGAEDGEIGVQRAGWPSVGEWKREGEGRKKAGGERRLALPRLETVDRRFEAWRREMGVPRPEGRELHWMEKEV